VQYFQFRKGQGGFEKFHAAVIDHVGHGDTRAFREVVQVGEALKKLAQVAGSAPENKIALVYDWENRWALEDARFGQSDKKYEQTVRTHYYGLYRAGFGVDIIDQTADLSKYQIVSAPMAYMLREGFADRVQTFVKAGGTFIMTYVSGYVNAEDRCFLGGFPGPLKEVAGIWAEEVDALFPEVTNSFAWHGKTYKAMDFCELVHPETAKVLTTYDKDFYQGMAALTVNSYGSGRCYYIAARTNEDFLMDFYCHVAGKAGVSPVLEDVPYGIGASKRVGEGGREYLFLANFLGEESVVSVPEGWLDLLGDSLMAAKVVIPPRGTIVLGKG